MVKIVEVDEGVEVEVDVVDTDERVEVVDGAKVVKDTGVVVEELNGTELVELETVELKFTVDKGEVDAVLDNWEDVELPVDIEDPIGDDVPLPIELIPVIELTVLVVEDAVLVVVILVTTLIIPVLTVTVALPALPEAVEAPAAVVVATVVLDADAVMDPNDSPEVIVPAELE